MKITYDPYADALYFYAKKGVVKNTKEVNGDILVDFDAKNKLLGIEILDTSKKIPKKDLKSVDLQVYLEKPRLLLDS